MGTTRQDMLTLLAGRSLDSKDISRELSITEKEVFEHLAHISRGSRAGNYTLIVDPYQCLSCGFAFKDRKKLSKP